MDDGTDDGTDGWKASFRPRRPLIHKTSLNPVPNAQVCVYLTVHITKLHVQTTFPKPLYITTFCMYPSGHWPLKILMFALLVTSDIATYS
jgi:hypothetical protein